MTGAAVSTPAPIRVFVVEDDDAVRKGLRAFLEGEGFDVCCFADAFEFLGHAAPSSEDVVVLDIGLPGLPGDGVVAVLARAGVRPRIIVVSGLKQGPYEAAVQRIAPEAAFRKPLNLRAFRSRIDRHKSPPPLRT